MGLPDQSVSGALHSPLASRSGQVSPGRHQLSRGQSRGSLRLGSFEQQVEMVSHEHLGMHPPAVTATHLPETEHERLPVIVGFKNGLAAVATRHHACPGVPCGEDGW